MGRSRVSCRSRQSRFRLSGSRYTYTEPVDDVGVGRETGATSELLLTGRSDEDGFLHGAQSAGVEGSHVENVNTLHLSEDFETLETGGLLEIGGNGSGLSTRTEEVVLALDLCN